MLSVVSTAVFFPLLSPVVGLPPVVLVDGKVWKADMLYKKGVTHCFTQMILFV